MTFYDPTEIQAYCSGQCQASRYPPVSCRCICGGRNHGILRSRPSFVDTVAYRSPETEREEKMIPLLPVERLQLTARDLAHDLDKPIREISWILEQDQPIQNRVSDMPTSFRPETQSAKRGRSIARRIGRSLKVSIKGYSESELNERIIKGMRVQFNQDTIDLAIDQAFQVFYSKAPDLPRPELYELYETNLIDKALELMGKRWVIGRPKK